jgi:hypothetical protein
LVTLIARTSIFTLPNFQASLKLLLGTILAQDNCLLFSLPTVVLIFSSFTSDHRTDGTSDQDSLHAFVFLVADNSANGAAKEYPL